MRIKKASNRMDFLRGALQQPWAVAWPAWMPRLAFAPAQEEPSGDTIVVVFLRGAADALNILVPFGDEAYFSHRPTLALPRPDDGRAALTDRVRELDDFFGLHPSLSPLLPAWQEGHLAPIVAVGAPDESRSHFLAMELMERGVEDESGPGTGWIGRHLDTLRNGNQSPLRAIGLGEKIQQSLRGPVPVSALRSIADFHLGGNLQAAAQMQAGLSSLHAEPTPLGVVGRDTLDILDALGALQPEAYIPDGEAAYPDSEFGKGLKQIAMLMKAQVGLEVAAIDLGGWDTHFAQGSSVGIMANLLSDLGQGLAAFHADLFDRSNRLTVVVMSEFGRRAYENASLGTDHGHGSLMMLLGGNVRGGKVSGIWPGLHQDQLFGPGDLAVTTDYRDVLAEVIQKRTTNGAIEKIFPDYRPQMGGFLS